MIRASSRARTGGAPRSRRRSRVGEPDRRASFVGVALLLAVAAIVGIVREAQSEGASAVDGRLQVPAIGELAIPSGRPQSAAGLGAIPSDIIAGAGAEWATSYDDGTLTRIDPATSTVVQTILVGHGASGIAIASGDAWVADSLDDRLARVSIATDQSRPADRGRAGSGGRRCGSRRDLGRERRQRDRHPRSIR